MDTHRHRARPPGRQLDGRPRGHRGRALPPPTASAASRCCVPPSPSSSATGHPPLVRVLRPEFGLLPHSFGRSRVEKQFWSMFADRDVVDPLGGRHRHRRVRAHLPHGRRPPGLPRLRPLDLSGEALRPRRLLRAPGHQLERPALFVWGTHDPLIPSGFRRHVEQWLPGRRAHHARELRPRPADRVPRADPSASSSATSARVDALFGAPKAAPARRRLDRDWPAQDCWCMDPGVECDRRNQRQRQRAAPRPLARRLGGDEPKARQAARGRTAASALPILPFLAPPVAKAVPRSASGRPTSTSATRTTSARWLPGSGCSPRSTSAPRCAAWATSRSPDRCCWSATTPEATSRRTPRSSRSPSLTHSGVERVFHQLAHNLVLSMPGLGILPHRTVAASHSNAKKALALRRRGARCIPAATTRCTARSGSATRSTSTAAGLHPPRARPGRPDRPGRGSIGGQETSLFLSRGEGLAREGRSASTSSSG